MANPKKAESMRLVTRYNIFTSKYQVGKYKTITLAEYNDDHYMEGLYDNFVADWWPTIDIGFMEWMETMDRIGAL